MQFIYKDILTVKSGVIVHQVNNKGVMGAGLARDIKQTYPEVYTAYKTAFPRLGAVQFVLVDDDLHVVNLYGQDGYGTSRCYTKYEAFRNCLIAITEIMEENDISGPVYMPYKIGCGLAGGNWIIVLDIIQEIIPDAIICRV